MKKQNYVIFGVIVGLVALSLFAKSVRGEHNGIYEDQLEVCNFESECVTIDIDDFMTKEKSDLLWDIFNNDIDTYDIKDMTVTPLK